MSRGNKIHLAMPEYFASFSFSAFILLMLSIKFEINSSAKLYRHWKIVGFFSSIAIKCGHGHDSDQFQRKKSDGTKNNGIEICLWRYNSAHIEHFIWTLTWHKKIYLSPWNICHLCMTHPDMFRIFLLCHQYYHSMRFALLHALNDDLEIKCWR